jgi:hypothetical protein
LNVEITGDDSTVANGQVIMDFGHLVNGCHSNFHAFLAYGHTWNSTSVRGFGLGLYSASISFSTSSSEWQRAIASNVVTAR